MSKEVKDWTLVLGGMMLGLFYGPFVCVLLDLKDFWVAFFCGACVGEMVMALFLTRLELETNK